MSLGSDQIVQLLDTATECILRVRADTLQARAEQLLVLERFATYDGGQMNTISRGPLQTAAEESAERLRFHLNAACNTMSSKDQTTNSISNGRRAKTVSDTLTPNIGNAGAAAKAYDILLGCKGDDEEQCPAWQEVRKGARHYLIQCCCVAANSTSWEQVEPVLLTLFSEERLGKRGYDQDLRSQLLKAYDHSFPGERSPYYRRRERQKQPRPAEQRQAPSIPSVAGLATRSGFLEQAQEGAVRAASQIEARLQGNATEQTQRAAVIEQVEVVSPGPAPEVGESETDVLPEGLRAEGFVVRKTFLDICSDDDCQSLKSAESWPQHHEETSLRKKKNKARRDLKEASSALIVCGSHVEEADGMDSITECDSVETLLTLAKSDAWNPAFVRKILDALEQRLDAVEFLEKVEQLTRELPPSAEAAAVACAEVLGLFAQTEEGSRIGSEIATALLKMLNREAMQQACLDSLLHVCRATKEVLGLATAGDQVCFSEGLRENIWSSVVAVSAERYEMKQVVVMILARTQTLSRVLGQVGGDTDLLQAVLSELFYTLEVAINCFQQEHDVANKAWACALLHDVAEQCQPMETCAVAWVREEETKHAGEYSMKNRLVLVGVMFGPESLAKLLVDATSINDATFIQALSRAISWIIHGLESSFGASIRKSINKCAEQNLQQIRHNDRAIAAVVGCVGSANKGADTTDRHLRQAIASILEHAKSYIGEDRWMTKARSLHHEVMWTLVQVFDGAPSLGEWTDRIREVARRVMEKWQPDADEGADPNGVALTCKYAETLLNRTFSHEM